MIEVISQSEEPNRRWLAHAERGMQQLLGRKDLGFLELPSRSKVWEQSYSVGDSLRRHYQKVVVLGIGGSALGTRVLATGLNIPVSQIDIWDGADALAFWRQLGSIGPLEKIHWLIVSKSGTTLETLTLANFVNQFYREKRVNFFEHATVISELVGNPLTAWAKKNKVRIVEFPLDVGGRFSVLTPVSLVPMAFAGIDLTQIREGAQWVQNQSGLVHLLIGHVLGNIEKEKWITLFWFYVDRLTLMGEWIRQLWSESLAKERALDGSAAQRVPTPMFCRGPTDQHSILQQIMEGAKDKYIWFFRSHDSESFGPPLSQNQFDGFDFMVGKKLGALLAAEASATQDALQAKGVPTLTLLTKGLGPKEFGGYFMLFELIIGAVGELLNINAYDQPGVELGKKLAKEALWKH